MSNSKRKQRRNPSKEISKRRNKNQNTFAALTAKLFFLRMVIVEFVCCACAKLAYNVSQICVAAKVNRRTIDKSTKDR